MLERFRTPHSELVVPLRAKKELNKRILVRDYEGTALAALLSDKYCAGIALSLKDWGVISQELMTTNPRKRIKLSSNQDLTRRSLFGRLDLVLQKHKERRRATDLLVLREEDSNYESFATEICLTLGWPYKFKRVGVLTREGRIARCVLRPTSPALELGFPQNLAIFECDECTARSTLRPIEQQSPFGFTLVHEQQMHELIREAYEKGMGPKSAFHASSDFYSACEQMEMEANSLESSVLTTQSQSSEAEIGLEATDPMEDLIAPEDINGASDALLPIQKLRAESLLTAIRQINVHQNNSPQLPSRPAPETQSKLDNSEEMSAPLMQTVDSWPLWNVLADESEAWMKLKSERESDLLRISRLENTREPVHIATRVFPRIGFTDSGDMLFWEKSCFATIAVPDSDTDGDYVRNESDVTIMQEVASWTKNLTRREVTASADGNFDPVDVTLASISRRQLIVAIDEPNMADLTAVRKWIDRMITTITDLEDREQHRKEVQNQRFGANFAQTKSAAESLRETSQQDPVNRPGASEQDASFSVYSRDDRQLQ